MEGSGLGSSALAKLTKSDVRQRALEVVADHPGGLRWAELIRIIQDGSPETPRGTIRGSARNLDLHYPDKVVRPERGLYRPLHAAQQDAIQSTSESTWKEASIVSGERPKQFRESDFYDAVAEWLRDDLNEVTEAVPLGGAALGVKWGTPDIVGVYRPTAADIVKFQLEIVSVEVKIDARQPIVAFGQAISYRLFSAKTYIAMPRMNEADKERLEALCLLFGMGLVLFDLDTATPAFEIRVRAQRHVPDMFYVNTFAEQLKQSARPTFDALFR